MTNADRPWPDGDADERPATGMTVGPTRANRRRARSDGADAVELAEQVRAMAQGAVKG